MIHNEDCLETMSRMDDSSVDLIITSPPYNKGYWSSNRNLNNGFKTKSRRIEYDGYNDCMDPVEYQNWQRKVISECLRILKPSGSLFYNHQPIQKNHLEINPTYIYDFPLKQTIIWNRKNTPKLDVS
jgi:DNA modification methylase